jgi:hypothetical protein
MSMDVDVMCKLLTHKYLGINEPLWVMVLHASEVKVV